MVIAQSASLDNVKIESKELTKFIGNWTGKLTYLDYSSGKPYSMPCDLTVVEKKPGKSLTLNYEYPNEPKANSKGSINIAKDGTMVNNKRITSKSVNSDGHMKIITEYIGSDGNNKKKALIRNVYIVGQRNFIIRKDVKFKGAKDWVMRNEYNFTRQ